jgi:flagellar motor switch protein FliM
MTADLQAQLEVQQVIAGTAYKRFMGATKLVHHRNLTSIEAARARAICAEAFDALTVSLRRIGELLALVSETEANEEQWARAPKDSKEFRRH